MWTTLLITQPLSTGCSVASPPLAPLADAVDDEPVPLPGEAVPLGDDGRHPLEALVAELGDGAAHRAEEVLVLRRAARGLVAAEPLAEVALDDQAAPHEDLHRAVDRRRPGGRAALGERAHDVVDREVAVGVEDDLGDRRSEERRVGKEVGTGGE